MALPTRTRRAFGHFALPDLVFEGCGKNHGLREEPRTKFHFAQAVRGMGEQISLERAQENGDGFQKLAGTVAALDSKSEKANI